VSGSDAVADIQGNGKPHGEIDRQYLDSSAIRAQLGWEPRITLDEGLRRTYEWYAQRLAGATAARSG
jgi:nucleoside-diphosphate-sugar epimerase